MRLGVLASGSGTILEAILDADLPVAVIADRACVPSRWPAARCPAGWSTAGTSAGSARTSTATATPGGDRRAGGAGVDVVVMAGFGTVLGQPIHDAFPPDPQHPPGPAAGLPRLARGARRARRRGDRDRGPPSTSPPSRWTPARSWPRPPCPVLPDDTEADLHERIKEVERTLYPETIRRFVASGRRRRMGEDHARRSPSEGAAVRLRQDRRRAPGPRPRELGWELVSSGGTSAALAEAGIAHVEVADVTAAPEMLGGRVKTLHPAIHGGILADRSKPEHLADLERQGIEPIDLVVCNLYPFASDPSVELIDVGGPTMVRAAAKNHDHVGVGGRPRPTTGRSSTSCGPRLAVGRHPARWPAPPSPTRRLRRRHRRLVRRPRRAPAPAASRAVAAAIHRPSSARRSLRYGENPHQRGARYRVVGERSWWDDVVQHGGQGALLPQPLRRRRRLAAGPRAGRPGPSRGGGHHQARQPLRGGHRRRPRPRPTTGPSSATAMSAFGGIVAVGGPVTDGAWPRPSPPGPQADVIIAPSYDEDALARLAQQAQGHPAAVRPGPRAARAPVPRPRGEHARPGRRPVRGRPLRLGGGHQGAPTETQWRDLALAWKVCARTTSNAIAVVTDGQAVGVGAGQQSRVVAAEIAVAKAGSRARVGRRPATPSSPSPTGCWSWPMPG